MKKISIISLPELLTNLSQDTGAKIVTLMTETVPTMRKTNNPYVGRVKKVTNSQVVIGFVYANSVNRARCSEGIEPTFTPSPRKWGVRLNGTPLVEHKGQHYLECRFLRTLSVGYMLDDSPLDDQATLDHLKSFFPDKSSNAEHQGLEEEVILRDYKLESIKAITYGGELTLIEAA